MCGLHGKTFNFRINDMTEYNNLLLHYCGEIKQVLKNRVSNETTHACFHSAKVRYSDDIIKMKISF